MTAGLGGNIYNREYLSLPIASLMPSLGTAAISQIESDLHATSGQLSLTVSLFILIQGGFPLIWCAISEIQGRKVS